MLGVYLGLVLHELVIIKVQIVVLFCFESGLFPRIPLLVLIFISGLFVRRFVFVDHWWKVVDGGMASLLAFIMTLTHIYMTLLGLRVVIIRVPSLIVVCRSLVLFGTGAWFVVMLLSLVLAARECNEAALGHFEASLVNHHRIPTLSPLTMLFLRSIVELQTTSPTPLLIPPLPLIKLRKYRNILTAREQLMV